MAIGISSCTQTRSTRSATYPKNSSRTTASKPPKLELEDSNEEQVNVATPGLKKLQVKYSSILNVEPSAIKNMNLYTFVDEWMGVGYKYGGTSKQGVDCSGFANALYNTVFEKDLERTARSIYAVCTKVGKSEMEEGDLVFFDIQGKPKSHVGVYLANNRFIHASTSSGVIISSLENTYYKKYFAAAGRID